MSKNYVRKTDRGKWSQENLTLAIKAVKEGLCTKKSASTKYGIPRTTLARHLKLGIDEKKRQGRTPLLSKCEKELEEFLMNLQNQGVTWTLPKLRRLILEFTEQHNIKFGCNNVRKLVSNKWINAFICNHPNLNIQDNDKDITIENKIKTEVKRDKHHVQNVDRCQWTEKQLIQAIDSVNSGICSHRSASKMFGIPRTTLIRHIKEGTKEKKRLGRMPIFGELEKDLTEILLKEQNLRNSLSMIELRRIAFNFAETHQIKHKFNKNKGLASYEWVHAFTNRHPEITVQKNSNSSSKVYKLSYLCEISDMLQIILEEGDAFDLNSIYTNDDCDESMKLLNSESNFA